MGISEPTFACIKTKSVDNVQRWIKKKSDMTVLVNISKHPQLQHFTVMILNVRTQVYLHTTEHLLLLKIQSNI